jgi:hypothetical protein
MNLNALKTDPGYATATPDQREFPRVQACNLISYAVTDRGGNVTDHCMGRALDLSQNGICLETVRQVKSEYISLMSNDVKENLIEIKGRVAYSRKNGQNLFRTGIRFEGTHDENIRFAKKLIRVYYNRRTGYHISTDRSDRF